ncbi:MAG: 23S rRNA (adenine(2503)-C(2))-methyltransferase RlmN, partial [Candidatus Omnitrophica bacterium]|nr:23S rRNA (adenine(2503)-C(2))-methyltransferase RlmN [Candidatus Omnitrophota bacterium]
LTVSDSKRSPIDGTTKYLFKLEDSNTIETVLLPEKARATICLSSQVGCKFACSFCASAYRGFVRNLKSSEILDEVIAVRQKNPSVPITNLVFMGIGEPLDNYDNVLRAIRTFNDKDAFNIGARKITISTCGIIPGIVRLKGEGLQIELSVSLHSAKEDVRSRLVPINKKYPIPDLIAACKDYTQATNRVITFEYVLIGQVNSSEEDARSLAGLLKGMKCKVNTISCNRITKNYTKPSASVVKTFMRVLKDNGINAMHRRSKGEDIDAGCGQLRIARL